jgi:hypothetical protein
MLKSLKIPERSHVELQEFCQVTKMPLGRAAEIAISRFVSSEEAQRIVSVHRGVMAGAQ